MGGLAGGLQTVLCVLLSLVYPGLLFSVGWTPSAETSSFYLWGEAPEYP